MARAATAVGLGLTLGLSACSTNREVTHPDPVPVTDKLLRGALLTAAELPDGWAASADITPIATDELADHDCDDALEDLDPDKDAGIDLDREGVHVSNQVAHFPGQGGAVDELFRDVLDDCEQVVLDDGTAVRATTLDFGVLSDETLPLRFELEPTTGPILERDLILVRNGDLVSILRVAGPRPIGKELLDTIVRASIGHLGIVAEQVAGR